MGISEAYRWNRYCSWASQQIQQGESPDSIFDVKRQVVLTACRGAARTGKLKHRHLTSQEAVKSQGMNIFLNCGLCAGLGDSVCSYGGLDGFTYTFMEIGCLVYNLVIVCAFISAALLGVGLLWMVALYLTRLVKMCKAKRARVPTSPLTPTPAPEPIAPAEAQNAEELRFTPQSSCIVSADCDLSEWHAIRVDE